MNFRIFANNKTPVNLHVDYDDETIEKVGTTTFLGLQINNGLNYGGIECCPI
jgi:hypothetical protein